MLFCSVTRIHCFMYLGFCHSQDQLGTKYTLCLTWEKRYSLQRDTGQHSVEPLNCTGGIGLISMQFCRNFAEYTLVSKYRSERHRVQHEFCTSGNSRVAVKWARQEQSKWILKPANSSVPPTLLGS